MLKNWNWMRVLRLTLGTAAVAQGMFYHNTPAVFIGGILLAQAVFNMGCCGIGACTVPALTKKQDLNKPAEYEELV